MKYFDDHLIAVIMLEYHCNWPPKATGLIYIAESMQESGFYNF